MIKISVSNVQLKHVLINRIHTGKQSRKRNWEVVIEDVWNKYVHEMTKLNSGILKKERQLIG